MNKKTKTRKNILTLVECAMMIALGTVLSFVKFWDTLPYGGSVTLLSMLPICMIAIRHNMAWGLLGAFVYGCLQMLVSGAAGWGLTPWVFVICLLFDYILAFTVLGFSGMFKRFGFGGKLFGIAMVCILRFVCHYISGITIWANSIPKNFIDQFGANPYLYSLVYNGSYMGIELVLTVLGGFFVIKALEKRNIA